MNQYVKQAKDFLSQTETTIEVTQLGKQLPPWSQDDTKPVNVLSVTLRNKRHEYTFNFYCSYNDTYNNRRSKQEYTYDILACLNVDHSLDFEDFCQSYGYDTDSRKALDTYLAVQNETKHLKLLWNDSELDILSEIA